MQSDPNYARLMRKHFKTGLFMSCDCIAGMQCYQRFVEKSNCIDEIIDNHIEHTQTQHFVEILQQDAAAFTDERMENREQMARVFDRHSLTSDLVPVIISILSAVAAEMHKQVHYRALVKDFRFAILDLEQDSRRARSFAYTLLWNQCFACGPYLTKTLNLKKRTGDSPELRPAPPQPVPHKRNKK